MGIVIKTDKNIAPQTGEVALYGDKVLVFDGNNWQLVSDGITNRSPRDVKREKAQEYLDLLGIKDDIDSILKERYPQYLI